MTDTPQIQTLSTKQQTVFDAMTGQPTVIVRIVWRYGPTHGPYTLDVPIDKFTAAYVQQQQQQLVSQLTQLK